MSYHEEYSENKRKYLELRSQTGGNPNIEFSKYDLIGIGDFSHGSYNIWKFRFDLLKKAVKSLNKKGSKIMIFIEDTEWHTDNIMSDKKIKIEKPKMFDNKYPGGKLWRYSYHTYESDIYLKIIKYIRENKKIIELVGVDSEELARDIPMFNKITEKINSNNINFFWASNHHVSTNKYDISTRKWIKESHPDHKHYCGYYLRKKLGNKYCIILSQAKRGVIRFNSVCIGKACDDRIWTLDYIYKKFNYDKIKKYKTGLIKNFTDKFIDFSNSYWIDRENSLEGGIITSFKDYDYVLLFENSKKLVI